MFLSKVTLSGSSQARHELIRLQSNGVYASHQLLWKLFSEQEERNFLYREEVGLGGLPQFYVLSQTKPSETNPLFSIQTKAFTPQLDEGSQLGFKLRVNPTVTVKDAQGKSKRHDVLMHAKHKARIDGFCESEDFRQKMEAAAVRWLTNEERLGRWGFALDVQPNFEAYTQHLSKANGNKISFSSVDFQGVLTVTDPVKFAQEYAKGFGRAKAMGCGLMLIRRV